MSEITYVEWFLVGTELVDLIVKENDMIASTVAAVDGGSQQWWWRPAVVLAGENGGRVCVLEDGWRENKRS